MSKEWGLWSKETVEGVDSWVSPDITRLRALLLVDVEVEELLSRDDACSGSFCEGRPRLLVGTVGV